MAPGSGSMIHHNRALVGGAVRRTVGGLAACVALAATGQAHAGVLAAFTSPFRAQVAVNNDDPSGLGTFSAPFVEPTIDGRPTDQKCVTADGSPRPANPALAPVGDARYLMCKPSAAS